MIAEAGPRIANEAQEHPALRVQDVIAIELARPLVYGAALSVEPRDVSAAKAAASEAALLAARASLQTHGAIGFTQEHDLSLWLLRVQALRSAWGTPEAHRRRVLEAL